MNNHFVKIGEKLSASFENNHNYWLLKITITLQFDHSKITNNQALFYLIISSSLLIFRQI